MSVPRLLALAAAVLAGGCASLRPDPFEGHLQSASHSVRECAQWFGALDRAVAAAGVGDAQARRVAGFPYLRVDRPMAALRARAARSEAAFQAFAERLMELDLEARRHELDNLPRAAIEALPGMGAGLTRAYAVRRSRDCGRLLREIDLAKPASRAALLEQATVADDYSIAMRALGLYPLTRLPFYAGVVRWQEETREAFAAGAPADARGRVRYAPPGLPSLARERVAAVLERGRFDPLGQALLAGDELERLAATYAPSFDVAVAADYDRFGLVRWLRGSPAPAVDASEAAVYVLASWTAYRGELLLQLAYTIWFPERPAQGAFDLLAGRLDGITWRVTLAPDGEPLVYDAMHPCGCYHLFFPTPRARVKEAPSALEEWAFIPQRLRRVQPGERPVVSIESATHYIHHVGLVTGRDSVARYVFYPYDELRSLPRLDGGKRSLFGPDGIVPGTERAERFVFWPMGIASAGAMRQWGRHATAFVGRRHFDDADLLERRFELDLGPAP